MAKDYIIQLEQVWAKVRKGTQPADVAPPSAAKIGHGFDYGEKPSHATFNWIMFKVMSNAVAFQRHGILPWDASIGYELGAVCSYADPKSPAGTLPFYYTCIKVAGTPPECKGMLPTDRSWWKKGLEDNGDYVKKSGMQSKEDPAGGLITGDIIITANARLIIEA